MSKHTPGPWRLGKSNLGNSIEGYCGKTFFDGDDGFRVVCMYQSCEPTGLYKEENENAKANARIIAAAPELLEACQNAINNYSAYLFDSTGKQEDETLILLKTAIAKATGE